MITTTKVGRITTKLYTCDCCMIQTEVDALSAPLYRIEFTIQYGVDRFDYRARRIEYEVCSGCVERMGLKGDLLAPACDTDPASTTITLEDFVRQMVADEVADQIRHH